MLVDVFDFVFADPDDVAVPQRVLLDELAVDVGAVGAPQVLDERIVEDGDDERVLAADREVVYLDVVVRFAPDGHALFVQGKFRLEGPAEAENEFCHSSAAPVYSYQLRLF